MNYIELINNFWQANKEHCFTGNETALYFYLVHTCNTLGWKNPFKHSNGYITGTLGISEKTLIASRNSLKQAGLLDFDSHKGRRILTSYNLKPVKITGFRTGTGKLFGQEQVSFSGANASDNIKLNQTKPNITKEDKEAGASGPSESNVLDGAAFPAQPKEEKEKGCAEKEKEESHHAWYQKYKDAWWQFYKDQNNGEEPPHSWRNPSLFNGVKKIQQDLAAVFDGDEEKAYQEFVYILSGWQHPKNYHRDRLKPIQIHNHLVEIRRILRTPDTKVTNNHQSVQSQFEKRVDIAKQVLSAVAYDAEGNRI
ncbi:hypothetical protein [Pontibacter sp. H249]|uniref:hypothetical protein n=1 Tax=Pontibacter sp. H249 TaxID=3133420 RepID=UPI0030C000CC